MEQISYKVGDLKKLIRESAQEFEPKLGDGVKANNKKNNEKSYKDAEKAAKDYDGGLQPEKKGSLPAKVDGNRTTLEYNPVTDAGKDFKDKVDAQAKGYTSKLEEENNIPKVGEFDNDGKLKKNIEDAAKEHDEKKKELAHSGLQGNNIKDNGKIDNTMYESKKPVAKRLNFKHTKFLNEAQMLTRIPEEYKKDGQVIYMKDAALNEYVVECVKSEKSGLIETNVVSFNNEKAMNEQVSRIKELFEYEHEKPFTSTSRKVRVNEDKGFEDLMNLSRGLIK